MRTDTDAHLVEITSLAIDSAGAIFVGDFYTGQISIFRPDGRLRGTVGRRGSGPGEYQQIRTVAIGPGDSLEVYDGGLFRLSVYPPGGEQPSYSVDVRERLAAGPKELWRFGRDSLWLALFEEWSAGPEYQGEVIARLAVHRASGEPVAESAAIVLRRPMLRAEASDVRFLTPDPFRSGGFIVAGPGMVIAQTSPNADTVYVAAQADIGIDRQFLIAHSPPTVTVADREDFVGSLRFDRVEPAVRRLLDKEAPSHWPVVTNLNMDDAGRLWVQLGTRPQERTTWWVLDSAGQHLLSVSLPADAVVRAVAGNLLYASRTSATGEVYVSVFDISKPAGGGAH